MSADTTFKRVAGISAILAGIMAFGVFLAMMSMPPDFKLDNIAAIISPIGERETDLIFWSMILDMFGYYLLLAPAALLLWYWIKAKNSALAALYTISGFAYILIGAIGAVILAATLPTLFLEYSQAAGQERETIRLVTQTISNVVNGGLWNVLEVILAAVWWVGVGSMLLAERRAFAILTIIIGAATGVDGFGNIFGIKAAAEVGLYIYLLGSIVWSLWIGVIALRGSSPKAAVAPVPAVAL